MAETLMKKPRVTADEDTKYSWPYGPSPDGLAQGMRIWADLGTARPARVKPMPARYGTMKKKMLRDPT